MIRYRNIITGCGTLFPARSMTSSRRPMAVCLAAGLVARSSAAVLPRSMRVRAGQAWAGGSRGRTSPADGCRRPSQPVGRQASSRVRDHRPADVEVAERPPVDELLEEQAGRDRAGVLATHVLDVGDLRVELPPVAPGSSGSSQSGSSVGVAGRRRAGRRRIRRVAEHRRPSRCPNVRMRGAGQGRDRRRSASTPSSPARTSPSAMTSRPSASALTTSTVLPPRMVSTSPRRVAVPGRHVVRAHQVAGDRRLAAQVAQRRHGPEDGAAPDMSSFIAACIASDGLRLMPPASYMIPLPTRPRWPRGCLAGG